jgi:hypothetical protein
MSTLCRSVDRLGAMTQPPADLHEMGTGSAQTPLLAARRNLILTEEVELPRAERPHDQSTAAVAAWLVDEAPRLPSAARFVDEFAWRMLASGLPLLRVTLHCGTLHPQSLGATYTWWRASGRTRAVMITHEVADLIPYSDNPLRRVAARPRRHRCGARFSGAARPHGRGCD